MDSPIHTSMNRFPQTNQLQHIKKTIFPAVWKHPDAWPFYTPVDPIKHNCPDYLSVIQKPMDLGTIKSKLNGGAYSCAQQCIDDFELMFHNCFNYNRGKNEDIMQFGTNLQTAFVELLMHMPTPEEVVPSSKKMARRELAADLPSSAEAASIAAAVATSCAPNGGTFSRPAHSTPNTSARVAAPVANTLFPVQMAYCKDAHKDLMSQKNKQYNFPFLEPVDPIKLNIPDYSTVIKKPMDLTTIKNNLDRGLYKSPEEFSADVRLVFTNCYRYNPAEHPYVAMAKKLQEIFEMKMARIPDEPEASAAAPSFNDSIDAAPNSSLMQVVPVPLAESAPAPAATIAPAPARSSNSAPKRPKQHASTAGGAPAAPSPAKKKKKKPTPQLQLNLTPDVSATPTAAAAISSVPTPMLLSPAASVSRDSLSSAPIPAMSATDATLIAKLDGEISVFNAKIRSIQTLQERLTQVREAIYKMTGEIARGPGAVLDSLSEGGSRSSQIISDRCGTRHSGDVATIASITKPAKHSRSRQGKSAADSMQSLELGTLSNGGTSGAPAATGAAPASAPAPASASKSKRSSKAGRANGEPSAKKNRTRVSKAKVTPEPMLAACQPQPQAQFPSAIGSTSRTSGTTAATTAGSVAPASTAAPAETETEIAPATAGDLKLDSPVSAPPEEAAALPPMSFEQKRLLAERIQNLPSELTEKVVDIIKAHQAIDSESSGEIELDFESLSDSTMRELESFLLKEQGAVEDAGSAAAASQAENKHTPENESQPTAPDSTSIQVHEATPPHAPSPIPDSPSSSTKAPDSPSQSALVIASSTTPKTEDLNPSPVPDVEQVRRQSLSQMPPSITETLQPAPVTTKSSHSRGSSDSNTKPRSSLRRLSSSSSDSDAGSAKSVGSGKSAHSAHSSSSLTASKPEEPSSAAVAPGKVSPSGSTHSAGAEAAGDSSNGSTKAESASATVSKQAPVWSTSAFMERLTGSAAGANPSTLPKAKGSANGSSQSSTAPAEDKSSTSMSAFDQFRKQAKEKEEREKAQRERQHTNPLKGFSIPRHKPISEVASNKEGGNGGRSESDEQSNKPSTSPTSASAPSSAPIPTAPAPSLKKDTPVAESGSKALVKPSPVSKPPAGSSQPASQVSDVERERQKEMERRKRQAGANQIDMNAASEILTSFESAFDETFH